MNKAGRQNKVIALSKPPGKTSRQNTPKNYSFSDRKFANHYYFIRKLVFFKKTPIKIK